MREGGEVNGGRRDRQRWPPEENRQPLYFPTAPPLMAISLTLPDCHGCRPTTQLRQSITLENSLVLMDL